MSFLFKVFVVFFSILIFIFIALKIATYSEAYEKVHGEGILDKIYDYFYYKTRNRMLKKKVGYKISCDNCSHRKDDGSYNLIYCEYCNRKYFSDWSKKEED